MIILLCVTEFYVKAFAGDDYAGFKAFLELIKEDVGVVWCVMNEDEFLGVCKLLELGGLFVG